MPSTEQQQWLNALDELMVTQKWYLNPQLTQVELAQELAISRDQLSELLSHHQAGSFYELLNQYRI